MNGFIIIILLIISLIQIQYSEGMNNLFDIIKNSIGNNDMPYCDIINENKEEVYKNKIRRMCSRQDYETYNNIYKLDKDRFINENRNNVQNNFLMGETKRGGEVYVPGIGTVNQIC